MSKFSANSFSKLMSDIDSVQTKKGFEKDETFFKLTKDKAKNATALIRFLPSKNIEDIPFARIYKHNFKDATTGRWYIENSLTTIGGQDMVSTVNKELWENNPEGSEGRKLASLRKRKLSFIANILVIKDLGNPENNGKVFKYAFGQKIWEKIVAASKPTEELDQTTGDMVTKEAIIAFDPFNGADFMLKMTYNESTDQYSYDSSAFGVKKAMFGGDADKIEKLLEQCYDIQLEVAPDKFKTAEELNKKFLWVIGEKAPVQGVTAADKKLFDEGDADLAALSKMATEPTKSTKKVTPPAVTLEVGSGDDDESFFKSLIED
jgi:gp32 DNA binding protein like